MTSLLVNVKHEFTHSLTPVYVIFCIVAASYIHVAVHFAIRLVLI